MARLRSERAVAGEMGGPVRLRATPPRPKPGMAPLSWRAVGSVIQRTLAMLLGR